MWNFQFMTISPQDRPILASSKSARPPAAVRERSVSFLPNGAVWRVPGAARQAQITALAAAGVYFEGKYSGTESVNLLPCKSSMTRARHQQDSSPRAAYKGVRRVAKRKMCTHGFRSANVVTEIGLQLPSVPESVSPSIGSNSFLVRPSVHPLFGLVRAHTINCFIVSQSCTLG